MIFIACTFLLPKQNPNNKTFNSVQNNIKRQTNQRLYTQREDNFIRILLHFFVVFTLAISSCL